MSLPPHLTPSRADIQGAIELAYSVIQQADPAIKADLAAKISVILGPAVWLIHTFERPDLVAWLTKPPTKEEVEQTWRALSSQDEHATDLQNAWSRLTPFLAQDAPFHTNLVALFADVLQLETVQQ